MSTPLRDRSVRRAAKPSPWLRLALPLVIVLIWLVGGGVGGPYFGKVGEVSTNDQSTFLPASAESTMVQQRTSDFLGDSSIPAVVVVTAESGEKLTEQQLTDLRVVTDDLAKVDAVNGDVSPPIASEDGKAVQFFAPLDSSSDVNDAVHELRTAVQADLPEGTTAWITGPAGFTADLAQGFLGIDGTLLIVAVIAVFVILVIVYRSPLLPILVLMSSLFALCVSVLTVWWLAKAEVFVLNGQVQGILFILVIGAATDYALLYVARYKEALGHGEDRFRAALTAWKGAFEPILASGGTVIAGLLCLLLSDLATNKALGPIASIGIGFAMLSALTFLPALMALFGRAAFWPFAPKGEDLKHVLPADLDAPVRGIWPKTAKLVARHPRVVWMLSVLVLVAGAAGVTQLKADGVPTSEFVLGASEARDGQKVLGEHFPGGSGSPAYIIVAEKRVAEALPLITDTAGVDSVAVTSEDSVTGQASIEITDGTAVYSAPGAPGAPAPTPTVRDGDVMLQITLSDAADSDAAKSTITDLRSTLDDTLGDREALVGGTTAVAVDTIATGERDRAVIIPIVLVVILFILMLLLRSVLAPVLLIASTILSYVTALGVSALVFNHILGFPGADPSVPLFGFVFLVALGVDYNIFLMSRVREESKKHGTREGILRGLVSTGGVITSAGLVLAATFAALGVIPILFLAQLAFIVAFGVLLDTFLVRSLLIPALTYDIGRKIWWPGKLSRDRK